ncbi:MAG: hypothetical protein V1257_06445 [Candidatus Neomarinimicrobiota bacterium]|jgi:serine protease inhibitor|nr:hypothetical protein [Candidatus Neomarinimicrobiota bacterium]MEE1573209.1 hypothetical protein [Candidatus Neomarinimicrobiota bacterium]|tara:strand:- start:1981 stop:2502 length:522 start_codon:yes stop_codon:yes gene_type:complete
MKKEHIFFMFFIYVLCIGCDDYEEESFSISQMDKLVCERLNSDSLAVKNIAIGLDTSFATMSDSIEYIKSLDSSIINISASPWSVLISRDTCYLSLNGSGETLIATNESLDILLFENNGQKVSPETQTLDLITVSDCPEMKTRYVFNLTSGDYLMRITGGKLTRTLFVVMDNE